MNTKSQNEIEHQLNFCCELMKRLKDDIDDSSYGLCHIDNYTTKREDIRRIRRELLELSKLLCAW